MGPAEQQLLAIRGDPQQLRSAGDFTDSLVRELNAAEGKPAKALMRELLAESLPRALELAGAEPRQRLLEAVAANVHKFPLREQQALARAHRVEISSEYRNLRSFVEEAEEAEEAEEPPPRAAAPAADAGEPALAELRRRLAALPPRPGAAAEELAPRILREAALAAPAPGAAAAAPASGAQRARQALFGDLRLNLFKFPEALQRELVERFPELRQEVARLVASMTQEISRWLDEERAASRGGGTGPLLAKLRALLQAVLSAPFSATFKHLGSAEKRGKEAFLLKIALCLHTCQERRFTDAREVGEQAGQLRRQFFHVEGYGELMDDWLQNRVRQFNEEEFPQRVTAVLGTSMASVLARLQRTFRPGRWLSLADAQLEEDVFALFLDESFPRHVLTPASLARMLRRVASQGGVEFHVYGGAARTPPLAGATGPRPQDPVEAALLRVLQRFPPFPALRRLRPGAYLFGRAEVELQLRGADLVARSAAEGGAWQELPAAEFFERRGPEEFPDAADAAVRSPQSGATTSIEDAAAAGLAQPGGFAPPAGGGQPSQLQRVLPPASFPPPPPALATSLPPPLPCQQALPPLAPALPALPGLGAPPPPALATGPGAAPGFGLSSLPRGPPGYPHGLAFTAPGGPGGGGCLPAPGAGASAGLAFGTGRPAGGARYEPYPAAPHGAGAPLLGGGTAPALSMHPETSLAGKFGMDDDEI